MGGGGLIEIVIDQANLTIAMCQRGSTSPLPIRDTPAKKARYSVAMVLAPICLPAPMATCISATAALAIPVHFLHGVKSSCWRDMGFQFRDFLGPGVNRLPYLQTPADKECGGETIEFSYPFPAEILSLPSSILLAYRCDRARV